MLFSFRSKQTPKGNPCYFMAKRASNTRKLFAFFFHFANCLARQFYGMCASVYVCVFEVISDSITH